MCVCCVSVCLSACLFAGLFAGISQKHAYHKFPLHVTYGRVSATFWRQTLCTSGNVDDVMFSHMHIQWLGGSGHPRAICHLCLNDIDSPAADSKWFYWVAQRAALLRGGGKACRLRLAYFVSFDSCNYRSTYRNFKPNCKYLTSNF